MPRYTFDEVRDAAKDHWGFTLRRGTADGNRDGRWAKEYSRTGFILGGNFPGEGYGYRRYASLARIVKVCDLGPVIAKQRARRTGAS